MKAIFKFPSKHLEGIDLSKVGITSNKYAIYKFDIIDCSKDFLSYIIFDPKDSQSEFSDFGNPGSDFEIEISSRITGGDQLEYYERRIFKAWLIEELPKDVLVLSKIWEF